MQPFPTPPTELINEILLESVLSTSDLARCCLVSRQFLPLAQQLLYYSVSFTTQVATGRRAGYLGGPLYALTPQTRALVNTLASSTPLANLVRRLSLHLRKLAKREPLASQPTDSWAEQNSPCFETPFPHLERLSVGQPAACDHQTLLRAFAGHGQTLSELFLERASLAEDLGPQSPPLNVKKLRCQVLIPSSAHCHLPAPLTVLDIGFVSEQSLDFYKPGASRLEVIRLPIHAAPTTLSGFKRLRHVVLHHVELTVPRIPDKTLIADCTALKTLAFEFLFNPSKSHLLAFLLASPASLTRLEFPLSIPFDVLISLLDPSVRPPFRLEILALSAGTAFDPKNAANFENLRSLCTSQGIQIELMKGPRDVFYV